MIRFMICDTDTLFLDKLASVLHQEFNPCSVEYMYGASSLEVSLRADSGGADVLLTEIELRSQNAIDIIGAYLKSSSPLQVIYMTSKMDYCTEVYSTKHCGFIMKPVQLKKLVRDVNRALMLLERKKESGIMIPKGGNLHIVNAPSIIYIESSARVIKVVTNEDQLETYNKLDAFSRQLDKRFVQCHKSYIINMERTKRFCGDSFLMENDVTIPISQSKRKEVRQRFLEYMGNPSLSTKP